MPSLAWWPSWRRTASCRHSPVRSKSKPWISSASMALSIVQVMASWAETSTHCASPVCSMRRCASSAAIAASVPAWRQAWGTDTLTGARSGMPCRLIGPPRAASVSSEAGWWARGPSAPNGVTRTWTRRSLAASRSASEIPASASAPGRAGLERRCRRRPPGRAACPVGRSAAEVQRPPTACRRCRRRTAGCAGPPGRPARSGCWRRAGEPPGGSTRITSAPSQPSSHGPISPRWSVRSSIRRSASSRPSPGAVAGCVGFHGRAPPRCRARDRRTSSTAEWSGSDGQPQRR